MNDADKRLLSLLRMNARMSMSELARRLDISRSTVQSRLKRLEQRKIITGYAVQYGSDYEKKLIHTHVLIKIDQKITGKVYVSLNKIPQISALYSINGDYDPLAVITAESTEELSALLDQVVNLSGIERTNSFVVLETKFSR